VVVTDEFAALIKEVGRRGFMLHAFRVDHHGPDILAAVLTFDRCADVVILLDEDHARAYRTPTGRNVDLFAPTQVYWSYASSPVWTLRALLTLEPPGDPNAPGQLIDAPRGLGLPARGRLPVRLRKRGR
jgi:hypothetical protein